MGDGADDLLAYHYPEVFGSPHRRYRVTVPRVTSRVFRIGTWRFKALSSGQIAAYKPGARLYPGVDLGYGETITRQPGSRAFAKGYPHELTAGRYDNDMTNEQKAQFWLDWKHPTR